jgi:hypothetical protein
MPQEPEDGWLFYAVALGMSLAVMIGMFAFALRGVK